MSTKWSSAVLDHVLIVSPAFALDVVLSTCHISNPVSFSKSVTAKDDSQTTRIAVLLIRNDRRLWIPVNFALRIDFTVTRFHCGETHVL